MKHLDLRDFIGGAVLVAIGLFVALYAASHYQVGEPARMGPAFFPVALGWILVGLGGIIVAFSFRHVVHVLQPPPFRPRPLAAVLIAILAFALLVDRLGLVPATVALVVIGALAEPRVPLRRTLLLAAALALIAWLIFTIGLQMQLPAFTFLD